jgi:purine-cytosine permease-like protein
MSTYDPPCGETSDRQRFSLMVLVILIVYVVVLVPLGGYDLREVVTSISVIAAVWATIAGRRPVQSPPPHEA